MTYPNFFIIGAPKCGTTALSEYLRGHPNVFILNPKEPNFFNSDLNMYGRIASESTYRGLFNRIGATKHAVGEASAWYLYSECAVSNILSQTADAKIIVMLRDPIELFQSLYYQELRSLNEDAPTAESAWHLQDERREGKQIPLLCDEPKKLQYGKVCSLGWQLQRLLQSVPAKQIHIVSFQDFVLNTKVEYENVLTFLGVPSVGQTNFPRHNQHQVVRSIFMQKIFRYISSVKYALGIHGNSHLLELITARNMKHESKSSLSDSFMTELRAYFREDSLLLEKVLSEYHLDRGIVQHNHAS